MSKLQNLTKHLFACTDDVSSESHSHQLDQRLGFRVESIESALLARAKMASPEGNIQTWGKGIHEGNQTWVGLHSHSLQTPYGELFEMCSLLEVRLVKHLVDLGAGYGRMGVVVQRFFPEAAYTGYEFVWERVEDGTRVFNELGLEKSLLLEQDLFHPDFILPQACVFMIYDYGRVDQLRHTMNQLEKMSEKKSFRVIGRGQGVRSLIHHSHPWLTSLYDPIHRESFSIYEC